MAATVFVVGLVGRGIQSSRTPSMHEREARRLGIGYSYLLLDFDQLGLADAAIGDVVAAAQAAGFQGLNVTHPFKQSVIPVLDTLSPEARAIGAVNTVVFGDVRTGHNTDSWGFAESFRESMTGAPTDTVAMFGAGGAGAAVAYALMELGVGRLIIVDSDATRAADLASRMRAAFPGRVEVSSDPATAVRAASGVVNTTPVGMAKYPGTPFDTGTARAGKVGRRHRLLPVGDGTAAQGCRHRLPDASRHRHGDLPGRPRLRTVHRPQSRPRRDGGSLRGRGMNAMTSTLRIECVVENRDRLGETPLWCDRTERLWWIDIENPRLHSYDPATGERETVALPGLYAGTQALTRAGDRLLAEDLTLYLRDADTGRRRDLVSVEHGIDNRLNDGRVDARGRFWVGTMDNSLTRPNGALYRVDANGTATRVESDVIVANGIAFSPDGKTLYFTDTRRYTSYAYDLDLDDGVDHQPPHLRRLQRDRRPPGRRLRGCRRMPVGSVLRGKPHRALSPRRAHRPDDRAAGHQPNLPGIRRAGSENAFCHDRHEVSGARTTGHGKIRGRTVCNRGRRAGIARASFRLI